MPTQPNGSYYGYYLMQTILMRVDEFLYVLGSLDFISVFELKFFLDFDIICGFLFCFLTGV